MTKFEKGDKVTGVTSDPYTHRNKYRSKSTGQTFPYIGRNTKGVLILESDNGQPFSCFTDDWEKVVPFTFSIQFTNSPNLYHYVGTQGDVAVGDRLLKDPTDKFAVAMECKVIALNTKSKGITTRFVGKRYVLEDLK